VNQVELTVDQPRSEYLSASEVVDCEAENIQQLAASLSKNSGGSIELAQTVYEYVRDRISHSFDIDSNQVTCKASDVLKYGEGICFAKSHLLAAILRCLEIPTGFCYQKLVLDDSDHSLLTLHGFNAIYLKSLHRWIRVDARGNKGGVQAEFSLEQEKLAFPIRANLGEVDYPWIYAEPNAKVLRAFNRSQSREALIRNLPAEL